MSSSDLKQRIEDAYAKDERSAVETGVDMAGQMTIAFCGGHHGDDDNISNF